MDYEEILTPVELYRDRLKAEHEKNTAEAFEELFRRSGVDESANAALVAAIRKLEKVVAELDSKLKRWKSFRWVMILIAIAGAVLGVMYLVPVFGGDDLGVSPQVGGIGGGASILSLALIFGVLNGKVRACRDLVEERRAELKRRTAEAWRMMEPLNRLYRWDTVSAIVMKTMPIMAIDRYVSETRLRQLTDHFRWTGVTAANRSVLNCQSGAVNGNPWVIADELCQTWEMKTYVGTLTISWEEKESYTDSKGNRQTRWVTRTQTLTATIEKPIPEYSRRKYIFYGNEAAPSLNFSRAPNSLAEAGSGWLSGRKLKKAIAALEKKSRDISNTFTIMDNREFDACFDAVDRDNEQQFRLLFTPLAQQEMLKLLRDGKQGYGDDFCFIKRGMINMLCSDHLDAMDISESPDIFKTYDLAAARETFNRYSNEFFRCLFFSFAPLFCVPLYQQHRNFLDIYQRVIDDGHSAFCEHESLANAIGEANFRPAAAVTQSILKTEVVVRSDHAASLKVCARAFRGEPRVEYVSKFGGDGKWHNVPVHWTEYLPVSRESQLSLCVAGTGDHLEFAEKLRAPEWQELLKSVHAENASIYFRRGLAAFLNR